MWKVGQRSEVCLSVGSSLFSWRTESVWVVLNNIWANFLEEDWLFLVGYGTDGVKGTLVGTCFQQIRRANQGGHEGI
jgi:hypothetical protein